MSLEQAIAVQRFGLKNLFGMNWADFYRKSTSRSSLPNRSCSLTILMNQSGLNISSLHVDSVNARHLIVPILSFACSSPAFVIDSLEACSSRFPQAKYIGRDVYLSYTFRICISVDSENPDRT
jgi:hypothetical protein